MSTLPYGEGVFLDLYEAVAECEAPKGTQVDDVLQQFQRTYERVKAHEPEPRGAPSTPPADVVQDSPGPQPLPEPLLMPEYEVEDEHGTVYIPFTDGWAVGFKVTPPDGVVQWVYLNPSNADTNGESNVFLYHDEDEGSGPHFFGALSHVVTYPESAQSKEERHV